MALYTKEQLYLPDGRVRLNELFYELSWDVAKAEFTVQDNDREVKGKTLISLKRIYLEVGDPTEWEFAYHVFGDWPTWEKFSNGAQIKKHVAEWRRELAIKLRSKGVSKIMRDVEKGKGASASTGARWLAERGWEETARGRPSAAEKKRRIAEDKDVNAAVAADMKRLGLKVVS